MVSKRLSAMAVSDFDPYSAGEGAVCSLLFGNSEEEKEDSKAKTASAPSKVCNDSSEELFDSTNQPKKDSRTQYAKGNWCHKQQYLLRNL